MKGVILYASIVTSIYLIGAHSQPVSQAKDKAIRSRGRTRSTQVDEGTSTVTPPEAISSSSNARATIQRDIIPRRYTLQVPKQKLKDVEEFYSKPCIQKEGESAAAFKARQEKRLQTGRLWREKKAQRLKDVPKEDHEKVIQEMLRERLSFNNSSRVSLRKLRKEAQNSGSSLVKVHGMSDTQRVTLYRKRQKLRALIKKFPNDTHLWQQGADELNIDPKTLKVKPNVGKHYVAIVPSASQRKETNTSTPQRQMDDLATGNRHGKRPREEASHEAGLVLPPEKKIALPDLNEAYIPTPDDLNEQEEHQNKLMGGH